MINTIKIINTPQKLKQIIIASNGGKTMIIYHSEAFLQQIKQ